jgi:hypothetical protein
MNAQLIKTCRRVRLTVVVLAVMFSALPVTAQAPSYSGATISGTAYAFSGRFSGRSAPFQLIVNRYSSAEEVQRLNEALRSGGQDSLLNAISGMSAGRIEVGTGVGVPANAILATELPNGETKLTVIFERRLRFSELRYGTRSADYKFGYAEVYLRRNGEGQGTLIPAAKIRLLEGNTWEVEDFGTFPARLMGLRARGGRAPR